MADNFGEQPNIYLEAHIQNSGARTIWQVLPDNYTYEVSLKCNHNSALLNNSSCQSLLYNKSLINYKEIVYNPIYNACIGIESLVKYEV